MLSFRDTKSIKINAIFNGLYQIMALIVPLITTPYISRILGPGPNGTFAFFNSIVSYFVIFVTFGFVDYGTKKVAENRDNLFLKTVNFASISICKIVLGFSFLALYLLLMVPIYIPDTNSLQIILIFSLYIISAALDPVFYFQGEEKFISICLRNMFLKIISTIFIFIFVKSANDLRIYTLILSLSQLASTIILFFGLRKRDFASIKFKDLQILDTFKKALPFFIPTLAVSLFTYLNQTMLGFLIDSEAESGYYSQALKIITLLSTFSSSIAIIMLSRISYLRSQNNITEVQQKIKRSFQFVFFISLPIIFGLCAVSNRFVPVFFGEGYDKCVFLIYILSPTIIFSPLNTLYGNIYYRPLNKIWIQTIAIFLASVLNIILSFVLIPLYASIGASIARVIAEFAQVPILVFFARKEISIKKVVSSLTKPLISSVIMFALTYCFNLFAFNYFINLEIVFILLLIIVGIAFFALIELLLRDEFFISNLKSLIVFLKKLFLRKKTN